MTYLVGGSHWGASRPADGIIVNVARLISKKPPREIERRSGAGKAVFRLSPATYRVEAFMGVPDVTPTRKCGPPQVLRVYQTGHAVLKMYCQVR
jgi:hypothetical protein